MKARREEVNKEELELIQNQNILILYLSPYPIPDPHPLPSPHSPSFLHPHLLPNRPSLSVTPFLYFSPPLFRCVLASL